MTVRELVIPFQRNKRSKSVTTPTGRPAGRPLILTFLRYIEVDSLRASRSARNNDEAMFRYIISHFVRQSIARSFYVGCWVATSHGFTTVSQEEEAVNKVETFSVSYSSEVQTGPSTGKVMATIFWDQDGILLADFLSPAIRLTVTGSPNSCGSQRSGTSDRTLTWTSPFITTKR